MCKVLNPHEITSQKQRKCVYQYSLDGKFIKSYNSLSYASKETKLSFQSISKCCLGQQKTCGGYQWSYNYLSELPPTDNNKRATHKKEERV